MKPQHKMARNYLRIYRELSSAEKSSNVDDPDGLKTNILSNLAELERPVEQFRLNEELNVDSIPTVNINNVQAIEKTLDWLQEIAREQGGCVCFNEATLERIAKKRGLPVEDFKTRLKNLSAKKAGEVFYMEPYFAFFVP